MSAYHPGYAPTTRPFDTTPDAQEHDVQPLPSTISLPVIAITSLGLWTLIYEAVSGVVAILS